MTSKQDELREKVSGVIIDPDLDCYEQADQIIALVKEWGDEPCPHAFQLRLKCECPICWQELKAGEKK